VTSRSSPTVLRRQLARVLRQMRDVCDLTIEEVSTRLRELAPGSRWSPAKLSRIENAGQRAQPSEVEDLLDLYGVTGDERATLIKMARQAREPGWWQPYSDVLPDWFQAFVDIEGATTALRCYDAELVPGLLQTEEYYRAVLDMALPTRPETIEKRVKVRIARQELLTREDAPQFWAILNEAALRRPVGGSTVMRDQLHHLVKLSELPNVILQVLHYGTGAHVAMAGSFEIMHFAEPNPDVVYLENMASALYLEEQAELDQYKTAFGHLQGMALPPAKSVQFIAGVAAELT
jgi:hypothetical protein